MLLKLFFNKKIFKGLQTYVKFSNYYCNIYNSLLVDFGSNFDEYIDKKVDFEIDILLSEECTHSWI